MCKVHHVNTIYMTSEQLFSQIRSKRSFLCVGLDTDVNKIPRHLLSQDDPVFAFNRAIVDATAPYAVCYKPNMAFYEESGAKGWEKLPPDGRIYPRALSRYADYRRREAGRHREYVEDVRPGVFLRKSGRCRDRLSLYGLRYGRAFPAIRGEMGGRSGAYVQSERGRFRACSVWRTAAICTRR